MKICPRCRAENIFDEAKFCKDCGAPLDKDFSETNTLDDSDANNDLDFVVNEAHEPAALTLMGSEKEPSKEAEPDKSEEALEISSTADVLDLGVEDDDIKSEVVDDKSDTYDSSESDSDLESEKPAADISWDDKQAPIKNEDTSQRPATEEEIKSAQEELLAIARTATPTPVESKPPKQADLITPIQDPAQNTKAPQKAQRTRGIAYFRKNNIQIVGSPFLHDGDEIIINDKPYQLRPKKMDNRLKIGLFALAVVVLMIGAATQFISSDPPSEGAIIGMILDENGHPYLEGAVVSIPSLDKKTKTNAQGFFKFDLIPTGTYTINYTLGDEYIGRGNTAVSGGQATLMSFNELESMTFVEEKKIDVSKSKPAQEKAMVSQRPAESPKGKSTTVSKTAERGRIRLDANIKNARLTLEGQILGAGNMVYEQIRSGKRKIKVDKTGYETYTATIEIRPGQTTTVKANLKRLESKSRVLSAKDYLTMGNDAAYQKKFEEAISDYNKSLELEPGSITSYEARAAAYTALGKMELAMQDYIRTGEIYRLNKKPEMAISAFTSAIELSNQNTNALIGRGGAKFDRYQYRSAMKDYEEALNIDKNLFTALFGSGKCQYRLGNYKKAEKQFKKAYKVDSNDPVLYHYLMLTYLARDNIKNLRKAYAEFKTVVSPGELAQFKSSGKYEPILRLIKEEDR